VDGGFAGYERKANTAIPPALMAMALAEMASVMDGLMLRARNHRIFPIFLTRYERFSQGQAAPHASGIA